MANPAPPTPPMAMTSARPRLPFRTLEAIGETRMVRQLQVKWAENEHYMWMNEEEFRSHINGLAAAAATRAARTAPGNSDGTHSAIVAEMVRTADSQPPPATNSANSSLSSTIFPDANVSASSLGNGAARRDSSRERSVEIFDSHTWATSTPDTDGTPSITIDDLAAKAAESARAKTLRRRNSIIADMACKKTAQETDGSPAHRKSNRRSRYTDDESDSDENDYEAEQEEQVYQASTTSSSRKRARLSPTGLGQHKCIQCALTFDRLLDLLNHSKTVKPSLSDKSANQSTSLYQTARYFLRRNRNQSGAEKAAPTAVIWTDSSRAPAVTAAQTTSLSDKAHMNLRSRLKAVANHRIPTADAVVATVEQSSGTSVVHAADGTAATRSGTVARTLAAEPNGRSSASDTENPVPTSPATLPRHARNNSLASSITTSVTSGTGVESQKGPPGGSHKKRLKQAGSFSRKERKYEVQTILGAMRVRAKTYYLVHWKGYSSIHNSWESKSSLAAGAKESIEDFTFAYGDLNACASTVMSPEGQRWDAMHPEQRPT